MRFPSTYMLSILRIVTALLFVEHGTAKLLGFPVDPTAPHQALTSLTTFAGVLELAGGVLLVVGLFTRVVAFFLSGEMAVAYFMVHFPKDFWPLLNKGELAVIYCFVFLYFVAAGGGAWSLDALLSRNKARV